MQRGVLRQIILCYGQANAARLTVFDGKSLAEQIGMGIQGQAGLVVLEESPQPTRMIVMGMAEGQCIYLMQVNPHLCGIVRQYVPALPGIKKDLAGWSFDSKSNAMLGPKGSGAQCVVINQTA